VVLLDELGEKFGAVHEYYNLRTPIDAIKLLCINYPAFQKELLESEEKGIGYRVVQAGTEFELEDMLLPFGSNDLIITPVIGGSGFWDKFGKILSGAALVGLAVVTGGFSALGATGFTSAGVASGMGLAAASALTTTIAIAGNIGIALTLRGVADLLAPQPSENPTFEPGSSVKAASAGSVVRGSNGEQSYGYKGPINSVGPGATIPVAFGKTLIGSHVLFADIHVTDDSDPLSPWVKRPSPDTMMVQGEKLGSVFQETSGMKSKMLAEYRGNPYSTSSISGGVQYLTTSIGIDLNNITRQRIGGEFKLENSGPTAADKFQIAFRLNNGLFDYVAGEGSTKIDGFIRFDVIIKNRNTGKETSIIPITVQGLMSGSQSYSWVNWFTIGKIQWKDDYELYILPVDSKFQGNTLEVIEFGYAFAGT
jgi:predicted phage tail protein